MSQDRDDDEGDRGANRFRSKEQQKEHIAWLREGDKDSGAWPKSSPGAAKEIGAVTRSVRFACDLQNVRRGESDR